MNPYHAMLNKQIASEIDAEVRLECLKLAVSRAGVAGSGALLAMNGGNATGDIIKEATTFYEFVSKTDDPEQPEGDRYEADLALAEKRARITPPDFPPDRSAKSSS